MKIYQIIFISLLFIQSAFGQKPVVKWGKEFELDKDESYVKVLDNDDENTYLQTEKYKVVKFGIVNPNIPTPVTPIITKMDKNFNIVKKGEFKELAEKSEVVGMELLGDNFVLITEKKNREKKSREFYMALINKELEVVKPNTLLWSTQSVNKEETITFDFSPDNSVMIINCIYKEERKDKSKNYVFKVINKDLETVFQKEPAFSQFSGKFILIQSVLTNDGDVYLIGKNSKSKEEKENAQEVYELSAYKCSVDGKENAIKVPMPDYYFPLGVYASSSGDNNDIYVFAQYTTAEFNGVTGYIVSKIDGQSNSVVYSQTNEFDASFIKKVNDLNYDKTKSKDPGISSNFSFSYIKVNKDNSLYVVMEKTYSESNQMQGRSYNTYYAQSLLAINIDQNGKQKWIKIIPKSQYYNSMTTYLNFFAKANADKLYVFYNETEKNIDNSLTISSQSKKFNDLKDFYQMMVEINSTGMMKKSVFLNPEQAPYGYLVKNYISTGPNQFLLIGKGYKKDVLIFGTGTFE